MLTYTIEHNYGLKPFVRKILHVEGKADPRQREQLKTVFFDALSSSDYLIVNIENVEEYDYSFCALISSIRRTAKLLGKRLTIKGKATDYLQCIHERTLNPRKQERFAKAAYSFYLWERTFKASAEVTGALKRPLARKKPSRER